VQRLADEGNGIAGVYHDRGERREVRAWAGQAPTNVRE